MLSKMKIMYKEWKEVVDLLAFVLAVGAAFLLVDTMPVLSIGIVMLIVAVAISACTEE